jgi:hypothetical protein
MLFTDCRTRFAAYVAENLRLEVQIAVDGVPLSGPVEAGAEFDVRVVDSNYPGGVIDTVPSDDPPTGSNLQDVRFHLLADPPCSIFLFVDSTLENTTFRSGWDVDASILTPGTWVDDMYVHFAAEHPTFALTTDDVLDELKLRGRAAAAGQIIATARATPRWRELSQPARSSTVTMLAAAPTPA